MSEDKVARCKRAFERRFGTSPNRASVLESGLVRVADEQGRCADYDITSWRVRFVGAEWKPIETAPKDGIGRA